MTIFNLKKQFLKLAIVSLVIVIGILSIGNYLFLNQQTAKKSKATAESVTLSFSPAQINASSGDFSTTIKVKPSVDMSLRGYEMKVVFDKTKVQVKAIQYNLGVVSAGLGDDALTETNKNAINQNGFIKIQGEIQTGTGQVLSSSRETDVITVTFTSISSTASSITIPATAVKFYKIDPDGTLKSISSSLDVQLVINRGEGTIITPSPTPPSGGNNTPTSPPGATNTPILPLGNITLNLKLKFQGILKKPATNTMIVRVKLGGTRSTDYQTGTFTSDENGIWSGSVSFNVPSGSGYIVYIKGPKHVQKKVCTATPTESFPGTYHCSVGGITLVDGNNNIDFSGIYQLVGDLTEQDGVVNSYDTSLVRNNLGKTDAESLRLADLNLDGKVDTQDWSLIIAMLSVRADEE